MSDLLERYEEHEFPVEDVRICLKPSLIDARDDAMARVAAVNRASKSPAVADDRMAAPAASPALAEAIAAVKKINDDIQAASITLRIKGVNRLTWNRFVLANPPRRNRQESFDSTKFFIYAAKQTATYVDAAGAEHEILPEEWDVIESKLSDGEHDRIAEAVVKVNRSVGAQDVSFFANGSETTPDSSETSE